MALPEKMLVLPELMRMNGLFSHGKHLFHCHSPSLCPRSSKSFYSQVIASSRHCLLIVVPINRWQRRTDCFAQCLRSSPQLRCPSEFSLPGHYTRQPLQAGDDQFLVAYLLRHRQASFVECPGKGVIATSHLHFPQHTERLRYAFAVLHLPVQRQTLLYAASCSGFISLFARSPSSQSRRDGHTFLVPSFPI